MTNTIDFSLWTEFGQCSPLNALSVGLQQWGYFVELVESSIEPSSEDTILMRFWLRKGRTRKEKRFIVDTDCFSCVLRGDMSVVINPEEVEPVGTHKHISLVEGEKGLLDALQTMDAVYRSMMGLKPRPRQHNGSLA